MMRSAKIAVDENFIKTARSMTLMMTGSLKNIF
jgi:hypothetical protein